MEKLPKRGPKDHLHSAAKGGLSCIPIVGGAVAALFETVLSAPIDKRKEQWLLKLAETVDELCSTVDGLSIQSLSENEEFISICIQASNIALRTHHEEKLRRLLNAIRSCVTNPNMDETKRMIFLRILDEMTELHIQTFVFLAETHRFVAELNSRQPPNHPVHWGDARNVWSKFYPDIKSEDPILDVVVNDLHRYGFVFIDKFSHSSLDSVATKLGREFLKFIEIEADPQRSSNNTR